MLYLRKDKNTFKNMDAIFIRELFYDENHTHSYDNNNHSVLNLYAVFFFLYALFYSLLISK
jgi:hypothetical protein